jgi:hypothetical protein
LAQRTHSVTNHVIEPVQPNSAEARREYSVARRVPRNIDWPEPECRSGQRRDGSPGAAIAISARHRLNIRLQCKCSMRQTDDGTLVDLCTPIRCCTMILTRESDLRSINAVGFNGSNEFRRSPSTVVRPNLLDQPGELRREKAKGHGDRRQVPELLAIWAAVELSPSIKIAAGETRVLADIQGRARSNKFDDAYRTGATASSVCTGITPTRPPSNARSATFLPVAGAAMRRSVRSPCASILVARSTATGKCPSTKPVRLH